MSERNPPGLGLKLYAVLSYAFLYIPILILILFSFNTSKYSIKWTGFTLRWYQDLFNDRFIWEATRNTLIIATVATVVSTIIGTAAALALHRYRFRGKGFSEATLYIPIIIPEVVMGIAMLAFFAQMGFQLGLGTIIIAHIAFCVPFVTLTVRARLHGFDRSVEEAAMDLGANEWITFWRITLPIIMPGVLAGALLAFTLSLDDYIITLFTAGPGSTTLPLRVFAMLRQAVTPKVNALSALWILAVLILLAIVQWLQRPQAAKR
jgi:spermidine/putrescine transport system permease protein